MEPGADLEHAGDAADQLDASLVRLRDPAYHLQQGRFAGAITADDPDDLTALDFEGHAPQCPEVLHRGPCIDHCARAKRAANLFGDDVPQSNISFRPLVTNPVFLPEAFN